MHTPKIARANQAAVWAAQIIMVPLHQPFTSVKSGKSYSRRLQKSNNTLHKATVVREKKTKAATLKLNEKIN